MANQIVITKFSNGNIVEENSSESERKSIPTRLRPKKPRGRDVVQLIDPSNPQSEYWEEYDPADVEKIVRADLSEVLINDADTLFDELNNFFFDAIPVVVPLVPEDHRVNTFADLPAPAAETDQLWYVRQATGSRLLFNYREKGFYRSTGAAWEPDNDVSKWFSDNFMVFTDDVDPTKTMQFQLSAISSGVNRVFTIPDQDGIIALLSQVSPKLDSVVDGLRIDVDNTDPNNPIVSIEAATDTEITANTAHRNGSVEGHNDVLITGITLETDMIFKWNGTNFVPVMRRTYRNPNLIVNNTNTPQDVINQGVTVQRLLAHTLKISYGWSLNDAAQDIVVTGSFGGQDLNSGLTDNTEIHRQEPKDTAGADPDGRGTNQRHGFTRTFIVTPAALGNNQLILQVAGAANGDLASIWDVTIEIEEYFGILVQP